MSEPSAQRVVLLLSTADTELLAARASGALYRTAQPRPPGARGPARAAVRRRGRGAAAARRPTGLAGGRRRPARRGLPLGAAGR